MAATANDALNAGNTVDLGNPGSVNNTANAAVASSAQPYGVTGLVNNGYVQNADGTTSPLKDVVTSTMQNQALNPTLSPQTQFTYNPIQNSDNTTLKGQTYVGAASANPATATAQKALNVNQPYTWEAQAAQVNPYAYNAQTGQVNGNYDVNPNGYNTDAQGYNAILGTAAQGQVDPNSMMQNQFSQLMNDNVDANGVPQWAETAATAASQRMNGLGLGASTMAGNAEASAILNAALPMAAANSQVVAQLNSQNLSNAQQTMLSNQSYENAAAQFNAQSKQQNDQFFASLTSGIANSNATRDAAIAQFNAGQSQQSSQFNSAQQASLAEQNAQAVTQSSEFNVGQLNQQSQFFGNLQQQTNLENAQLGTQTAQFNATQQNAMTQFLNTTNSQIAEFNSQNQLLVDQSNVQWQRAINTANTAGDNAANQANTMNTFNLQQTDLNNLWQQARDEASWSLTSSENSQNRALTLVNSALNRQTSLDILNSQMQASMFSSLGSLGVNILGGVFGGSGANGIGAGIGNLLGIGGGSSGYGGSSNGITTGGGLGGAGYGGFGDFGGGGASLGVADAFGAAQGGLITNNMDNGNNENGISLPPNNGKI